jgi:hypothetical protein
MKEWAKVHTAANILDANLIKGKLESEEIPVMLKYEVAGQIYGITVNGLSEVRVFVPREMQKEAAEILNQIKKSTVKLDD